MLLHDAEWVVDDAARRMSLAQKEADRALLSARTRMAEVLAFDKDAEIAKAIESARVASARMAAELADFTAQYETAFAEIDKAESSAAWDTVKDRARILASDFASVAQKFADQAAAIQAVATSAKGGTDKQADLAAVQLITKG